MEMQLVNKMIQAKRIAQNPVISARGRKAAQELLDKAFTQFVWGE